MDLSQVFAVLQQADQQAQKTNPYGGFENISDQLGGVITKAAGSGNYGFGEILGASLLDGLMGGVAQHYGNEYRADQNKMAQDSLFRLWSDGSAERPEGMNPNVWSSIDNAGKLFGVQRALDQQDQKVKIAQQIEGDIARAKALAPLEVETTLAKNKGLIDQERQRYGAGFAGLGSLPSGLQDNAIQQAAVKAQSGKVLDFIDQQFEAAKKIPSLQALIPETTAANNVKGISITLGTALQAALGREMNAKEQERLQSALPDWNDSATQIEAKKQMFKEMYNAVTKATPLADSVGLGGPATAPMVSAPGAAASQSQRPQITAEQARALLKQRGIAGYE